jgi:hypothetical protein
MAVTLLTSNLQCVPKVTSVTITNGTAFGGAALNTLSGVLGVGLVVDGSQLTGTVTMQLNGDTGCVWTLYKGQQLSLDFKQIQFNSVDFANASGSSQTVQYMVSQVPFTSLGGYSH